MNTFMQDIRIAAVIFNSTLNQPQHNLGRMLPWIREAKNQGVNLICFPELNITGYSTRPEIKNSAEPVPGPISQSVQQMAYQYQVTILAGLAERDQNGRIYASHMAATPDKIAGVYRKLHIAPPERAVFSAGSHIPLFEFQETKFGIQLCYDAHFPGLSTRMAVDGVDVIFMPHASPRGTPPEKLNSWLRHLTARAYDNSVFIIACNQVGENANGFDFPGVAVAIAPSGNIIKKNISGREDMLIVDLKAQVLFAVRNHQMRYFLPHRRPELY
jgi:N-carbamoylputrescine amidase